MFIRHLQKENFLINLNTVETIQSIERDQRPMIEFFFSSGGQSSLWHFDTIEERDRTFAKILKSLRNEQKIIEIG